MRCKINSYRLNTLDSKIIFLFSLWLLVDALNGWCLRSNINFPVSQLYKSLVCILVIIRCRNHKRTVSLVVLFFLYVILYSIILLCNNQNVGISLILCSKLITSCIFYSYFLMLLENSNGRCLDNFNSIFKFNFIIFSVNILLGLLGIGYNSYLDMGGVGHCGFFYAINELSGVVIVLYPFVLHYLKINYNNKIFLLGGMFVIFISVVLSTKSSIAVAILSLFYISYHYGSKNEKKIIMALAALTIISVVAYIGTILSSDLMFFRRFSYFLKQEGIVGALTSGRLSHWQNASNDFYASGIMTWVFGIGGNRTVEMDPYDALLNMGIIGLFLLLIIYFKLILYSCKCHDSSRYMYIVSNVLLVLISIFSGHILFSSMAGMLIALSFSILTFKRKAF